MDGAVLNNIQMQQRHFSHRLYGFKTNPSQVVPVPICSLIIITCMVSALFFHLKSLFIVPFLFVFSFARKVRCYCHVPSHKFFAMRSSVFLHPEHQSSGKEASREQGFPVRILFLIFLNGLFFMIWFLDLTVPKWMVSTTMVMVCVYIFFFLFFQNQALP
jgi:hypothetical protein